MTKDEFQSVMHFIAQGAINISQGLTEIKAGSPIHHAMQDLCEAVEMGEVGYHNGERWHTSTSDD